MAGEYSYEVLLRFFYLTSVAVVTGVSAWLSRRHRHLFFRNWTWAYLFFLAASVVDALAVRLPAQSLPFFAAGSAGIVLSAYFFARAGLEMRGRQARLWHKLVAAGIFGVSIPLWRVYGFDIGAALPALSVALVFAWLGYVLLAEQIASTRVVARTLAILLIAKGSWSIAYPLLVATGIEKFGYWADAVLHLLIGMGMLVFVLERSAEEMRLLVDSNVRHSFFLASARGEIASWNSGARRLHGFEEDEVVGSPLSLLSGPAEDFVAQLVAEASSANTDSVEREGWLCRKDGGRFWARVVISLVRDGTRSPRGFAVLVNDLSDRRALEQERARLSAAVRQSNEAIVIADGTGRVQYVNLAFERSRGLSSAQVVGVPLPSLDFGGAVDGLAEALERREAWYGRMVRKQDARTIVEDLVLSPVRGSGDGVDDLFVLRIHDVSRETVLQEQVHQARKMEEIGRLSGGVAHEFGNLLAIIVSYNHLLKRHAGGDEVVAKSVEAIARATNRADRLIRQLLSLCRQDVKVPQSVEINGFVSQFVGMAQRVVGEDLEIRTLLGREAGKIRVDPEQLEQALMNLALNARDATPPNGTLTFGTSARKLGDGEAGWSRSLAAGRYLELTVTDTGIGMSPEVRARAFEPFFTTKPAGKGTGIGLAFVESFVHECGGAVSVESEPGRGTSFRLLFPELAPAALAEGAEPVDAAEPGAPLTVLVVDDEPLLGQAVRQILEGNAFHTIGAASAAEALELTRSHRGAIDLLLTDVTMPAMSGRKLAELLQGVYPRMKTLFMSGHTDDPVVRQVREAGGGFIAKPFEPEELLRKVSEMVQANTERSSHEEGVGLS